MFTLIAIGYLFFKKNMITIQGSADMGKVLLYLVIPVVIVNSFWIERTQEKTMELLYSILLSIVAMGLSVLIGYLFFGKKDGISAFSSAFLRSESGNPTIGSATLITSLLKGVVKF